MTNDLCRIWFDFNLIGESYVDSFLFKNFETSNAAASRQM